MKIFSKLKDKLFLDSTNKGLFNVENLSSKIFWSNNAKNDSKLNILKRLSKLNNCSWISSGSELKSSSENNSNIEFFFLSFNLSIWETLSIFVCNCTTEGFR